MSAVASLAAVGWVSKEAPSSPPPCEGSAVTVLLAVVNSADEGTNCNKHSSALTAFGVKIVAPVVEA